MAMCLLPSDRRHSILSRRRRIALARRKHIVILSSSALQMTAETMSRAALYAKRIAHFRHRILK